MKTIIGIGVCFFSLLGTAAAQSSSSITFNLPSAVLIGNSNLPAGNYTVRTIEPINGNGVVIVDFTSPRGVIMNVFARETPGSESASSSEVVLKSDGKSLRLSKIMIEGRAYAFEVAH